MFAGGGVGQDEMYTATTCSLFERGLQVMVHWNWWGGAIATRSGGGGQERSKMSV